MGSRYPLFMDRRFSHFAAAIICALKNVLFWKFFVILFILS
jgi:hypothetical protein